LGADRRPQESSVIPCPAQQINERSSRVSGSFVKSLLERICRIASSTVKPFSRCGGGSEKPSSYSTIAIIGLSSIYHNI
ncbi:hypothetical protein, partial [[Eubacterium] cellulosolvens]